MEMSGKVAVITGGTSGIGRSTAEKLLERGAAVLILGRDRERGAEMERLGDCHFYPCDMACPEEIAKTCDAILRDYPEIDILVNNAGMSIDGTVETLSLEEWNRIFAVNVTSVYLMSKHLIPAIRRRGGGRIINIASLQSSRAFPNGLPYGASKGGIAQLTRGMAEAWSRPGTGITANAIAPGFFKTQLTAPLFDKPEVVEALARQTTMNRVGFAEDIQGLTMFLASPASGYITGQVIHIDGGWTAI